MTTGPWKPISLDTYQTRISEVRVDANVSEELDAEVKVLFSLAGAKQKTKATVTLISADDGTSIATKDVHLTAGDGGESITFKLEKDAFKLWYPVGYGKQPLYEATVELKNEVCYKTC